MKANELRIGNWVNLNDGSLKDDYRIVKYIKENSAGFIIKGCTKVVVGKPCNDIYAIPLTEEILLKCGFENEIDDIDGECYNIYFVTNTDYLIEYFHKRKEYVFTDDMGLKVPINSIHQLQNLYFALTGQELEVTWS